MPELLVASTNAHKIAEIRALLGTGWTVLDLNALPPADPPEETGATFAENAALKAAAVGQRFVGPVIADDSGLEVDALGGAPGVHSARYAGMPADDARNRARLLRDLRGTAAAERKARFVCVIALAVAGRFVRAFRGEIEGRIAENERGQNGFGYDSLFIPKGFLETFGELPAETKNRLSHRAKALVLLQADLRRPAPTQLGV